MPARSIRPLIKIHFRIYKDTYEALLRMATAEMGHNAIARNVLDKFVKQAEDHIRQRIDEVEGRTHNAPHTVHEGTKTSAALREEETTE